MQGGKTEDFVSNILEPEITGEFLGNEEINNPEWYEPHAGLDESGKGICSVRLSLPAWLPMVTW